MNMKSGSPLTFDQLQEIISSIYDAALEPDLWNTVLEKIAYALKAEQAYMRIINTEANDIQLSYSYNKNPHWLQAYKDYYIHKDPWLNGLLKSNKTVISCTHHHIEDKEYESTEYHRDLVTPQGIHYGMGGKIIIEKNIASYLALNRDRKRQGFEDEYFEILKFLTPHIQKSLLINERTRLIDLKQNILNDALNQINNPLLLVNKNGEILFINLQAEQLLVQQENRICIKNNHLIISSPDDHKQLKQLIHKATDPHSSKKEGGAMCLSESIDMSTISIIISPVNPNRINIDDHSKSHALLALSTLQSQESPSVELLTVLYNLTSAEARLTVELCQGLTLDEISGKLGLSRNTLKSQLRTSFTKTGVSRQADLIRLINSGPAGIIKAT